MDARSGMSENMLDFRTSAYPELRFYKEVEATLRERYADKVFKTKIRKNVSIAESPLGKKDITAYNPKSNGARDFVAFTEELLSHFNM